MALSNTQLREVEDRARKREPSASMFSSVLRLVEEVKRLRREINRLKAKIERPQLELSSTGQILKKKRDR